MIGDIKDFWNHEKTTMTDAFTHIKTEVADIITPVAIPIGVAATAHSASFTADKFLQWGSAVLCVLTSVHVVVMIVIKVTNFVEKKRSHKQEREEV